MRAFRENPTLPSSQSDEYPITMEKLHPVSLFSLTLRIIPLLSSFILFAFAATPNANAWGIGAIQKALGMAFALGIIGVLFFIPKRVKHLDNRE